MIITYQGGQFFKVQFGDTILAFNPISKDSKLKQTRFGADIALITTSHPDFNGVDQVSHGDKKPFIINGPGEYEAKNIFIKGIMTESKYGIGPKDEESKLINTIYTVSMENMNLCFLGALSSPDLKSSVVEAMDGIDILFVPVGGDGVLSPSDANKIAVTLEPKIIIPMHYGDIGQKDSLKMFLKEAGENPAPIAKLTIKKKDLEGKEGDIVVLDQAGE